MENTKKGFTLVEVLIVVVIIAILASLIVPRMLMQTEKAKAAEALQMVGAMKRALERYVDMSATRPQLDLNSGHSYGNIETTGHWSDLGLPLMDKSQFWNYFAYADDTMWQVSVYDAASDSKYIVFTEYYGPPISDIWGCDGVLFKSVNGVCTV